MRYEVPDSRDTVRHGMVEPRPSLRTQLSSADLPDDVDWQRYSIQGYSDLVFLPPPEASVSKRPTCYPALPELSEPWVARSIPALLFADDRGREGA